MAKKSSRTREARQRRQRQRRQSQRVLVLMAIVVIAVVAIAVIIVSNQPVDAFIPDDLSARYEDLERSFSSEGYPRLGESDAPVTVQEYASFACPGCEAFHSDSFDAVLERVREGQVIFTYVPLQTGSVPNAPGASRAALCAGKQGMFWEMHDVLFDWQTRYGNTAFSQNRLLESVDGLGLSSSAFTSCFNSAEISATLNAALNEDVSTTPTIRVNGVTLDQGGTIPSAEIILQAIDDATPTDWGMPTEDASTEPTEPVEPAESSASESADQTAADTETTDDADVPDDRDAVGEGDAVDEGDAADVAEAPEPDEPTEPDAEPDPDSDENNEDSATSDG